jgi:tripartite-type tricarboxylate transporter receptor subunit TctC
VLLRDTLGLNLKIINGYPDSGAIFLAVDRKEVDGRFVGTSAVRSSKPDWLRPGSDMKALLQFARTTRHPDFPDVPTARELARDDRGRALIELAELPYLLSRPMAAPPGIPADRAAALQDAFMAMQKDPEYLRDADKLGLDISPVGGVEALRLIDRLAASPPDLFDTMRKLQADNKGDK